MTTQKHRQQATTVLSTQLASFGDKSSPILERLTRSIHMYDWFNRSQHNRWRQQLIFQASYSEDLRRRFWRLTDWSTNNMRLRAGLNYWRVHDGIIEGTLNGISASYWTLGEGVGNLNFWIDFRLESLFDHKLTAYHTVTWLVKWSILMPNSIASWRQWEGVMEFLTATIM